MYFKSMREKICESEVMLHPEFPKCAETVLEVRNLKVKLMFLVFLTCSC